MPDLNATRAEMLADLTRVGADYELLTLESDSGPQSVLRNAPPTIRALLEHSRRYGSADYIVFGEERITYEQAYQQTAKVANILVDEYGVAKGDRVAIAMRNYPEWVTACLAITSIGAIAVAINSFWGFDDMKYALKQTGARLVIADQERVDLLAQCAETLDLKFLAVRCGRSDSVFMSHLEDLLPRASAMMPAQSPRAGDDALIIFTSGSTGYAKAAVSSHRAVIHAIMAWDFELLLSLWPSALPLPAEIPDFRLRILISVPLFHVTGINAGPLSALWRGREIHLMYKWDVMQAMDIVERESITNLTGVPTISGDLVRAAREHNRPLDSLLGIGGGGEPRSTEQVIAIDKVLANAAPTSGWGMTETNGIGSLISGDAYLSRPQSAGQCAALMTMRIVDDQDQVLPDSEAGHLQVKGTPMFRGYWNNSRANEDSFVDGWFRTGDIAHFDKEGYLFIVDRAKDIVIRGGEKIGCGEVENVVRSHPSVKEAIVFAIPHERLGEQVAVAIVREPNQTMEAEELQKFCSGRLANFQIPSAVFFSNDDFPRVPSGKINKREIKKTVMSNMKDGPVA